MGQHKWLDRFSSSNYISLFSPIWDSTAVAVRKNLSCRDFSLESSSQRDLLYFPPSSLYEALKCENFAMIKLFSSNFYSKWFSTVFI